MVPVRIPFVVPRPGTHAVDVVGLGLNSIDLVAVVDRFPERNAKQPLRTFARMPGGQIATALTACARLGWTACYVGTFGDDELGRVAQDSLTSEGIALAGSRVVAGTTNQFAVVIVDSGSGERTILWNRHPGLKMTADAVPRTAVTSGRLLIVDCFETEAATEAASLARAAGIPTIVDVEKVRPGIDALLRQIDAIIAAESFPSELTGLADTGRALEALQDEFRAPVVCVTLGRDGSLARCGGREFRTPGFRVECVDSTGAGDAFRGGFAAACLRDPNGDLEDALAYANAVAALNCRALGARGGLPTRSEVDALLYARF
jgi:sulfofructose kinase